MLDLDPILNHYLSADDYLRMHHDPRPGCTVPDPDLILLCGPSSDDSDHWDQ
jgi:hypothetical protein